jgi:DNA-binding MarR family transcriptional regulator
VRKSSLVTCGNLSCNYLVVKYLAIKILFGKFLFMKRPDDTIDQMILSWREVRPDLDPSPLELVGRIIVLAQHLEKSVNTALAHHGLTLGQFDILATLRRHSDIGGLTPSRLLRGVMLSSGGMTSRLDRLAELGLVVRKADLTDRRGVVVELTARGRKVIDAATETRFEEAAASLPEFSVTDRRHLAGLLRKWLTQIAPVEE